MRATVRFAALPVVGALVALSSLAAAAPSPPPPVTFWVEPDSEGCVETAAAIARDLTLACDASRPGCRVARAKEEATSQLVVRCEGGASAASISALDRVGERWTVNLSGPAGERSRSAALYAIRFETTDALTPPAPLPAPPPAAMGLPVERHAESLPAAPAPDNTTAKVLTFGGFGVALVAGAVGAVTSIESVSKASAVRENCLPSPSCSASELDQIQESKRLGNIATASWIVTGAGVATGIVGLVLWQSDGSKDANVRGKSASVRAMAGASWVGLAGSF